MKKILLTLLGSAGIASVAFAGTETYSGKEMKQVAAPPPCPQWYADNEFNVSLWGTYIFTGNQWRNDRYIRADHAWGGGIDAKYFFHRYFGVGIEGWAADSRQAFPFADQIGDSDVFHTGFNNQRNAIGAVLGTITFRYPIPCSRWSPYAFAGGGGIFGGGQRVKLSFSDEDGEHDFNGTAGHTSSTSKGMGQFGGGIEYRFTPHIGFVTDFSWNVVDGPNNNFGMVRTGVNFAF